MGVVRGSYQPCLIYVRILSTLFDLWYYISRMDKGFYLNEIGDKVSYMLIGVFYPLGLQRMQLSGPNHFFFSININELLLSRSAEKKYSVASIPHWALGYPGL